MATGGGKTATLETIQAWYRDRTPGSASLSERALKVLTGGTTRTSVFFPPYPPYIVEGHGCRVTDQDGVERVDFLNNYTSLILGHAHPAVVKAVGEQMARGSAFAAPTELEIRLAEILCRRIPSFERMRFANSGTEAGMFVLRLARAFTKRPKIAKFEGGFHGTHESVSISVSPPLDQAGPPDEPRAVPESAGISPAILAETVILPFNNPAACERIIARHKDELAAVIVEPIIGAGGTIPSRAGFLTFLREITRRFGILLIFDEVISIRVAPGGAQELYGLMPDVTMTGKIIGGGFPVAAFGGREEIMALLDPRAGPPAIPHSGTFNGNPIGLAAGIATMELMTPEAYRRLNAMGDALRSKLRAAIARSAAAAQVTGEGSLFQIHCTAQEVTDYRSAASESAEAKRRLFLHLLNSGFFIAPRGMACLSMPMTEAEIDAFVAAVEDGLR